ncbi:MAG: type IV secretory system conjugative DNA transfer family protein [Bdellovibrionales bacterium]
MNQKPLERGDLFLVFLLIGVPVSFTIYRVFIHLTDAVTHHWNSYASIKYLWVAMILGVLFAVYRICLHWNGFIEGITDGVRKSNGLILLGHGEDHQPVHLTTDLRTRHTQVIGTTSSGKSESVILPWAIQDIQNGGGLIIVDGKADKSFLDKIYAYAVEAGRASDFRLFSLSNPAESCSFNPLAVGSVQEVTERVFSSFKFESEYFESIQFRVFRDIIAVIKEQGVVPTFSHVHTLLTNKDALERWIEASRNDTLKEQLTAFNGLSTKEREERTSGLIAKLSHFCADEVFPLFNATQPHIDMSLALKHKWICYFQLPTMYYQFLGASTGKLVLQCLQNAVAKRHNEGGSNASFTSVYLDDFQDYIYEGFEALLNKSRSANIGMVFSHQALGDLDKVGPAFRNVVTTNTNIKVVMRNNDPETAEFFANSFGTKAAAKETERVSRGLFGNNKTGELSVRAVEEYLFHPNIIKSNLRTGEALVSIPYFEGVKTTRIRFTPFPNKDPKPLPCIPKEKIDRKYLLNPPGRNEKAEVHRVAV